MIRLIARLVYLFDRIFPRVRVGGRGSGSDYSEWEYAEGKRLLTDYAEYFGSLDKSHVLDIGCGMGGKTVVYSEAGARVVGVDISTSKIALARCYAMSHGVRALFVTGDAETLPFADSRFDMVIANDSLEHFSDSATAFSELSRVLRPGGRLFLSFTPWRSPLGSHLYDYIRTPWCNLLFSECLIEELLRLTLAGRGEDPEGASQLMYEYRTELNRITVRRYRKIIRDHQELDTVFEYRFPPKYKILAPLVHVPFLGELFTGTVVALMRKR